MTRNVYMGIFLFLMAALPMAAQPPSWDSSGNSQLNGTYYFREAIWVASDSAGNLQEAYSVYGNVTFNGTGTYSMSATYVDGANSTIQPFTTNGSYAIAASGFGFITNPLASTTSSPVYIYGSVANGIFIGSATESNFNDMFIAAPVGNPNSTFNGTFQVSYFDPTSGVDAQFALNPSNGSLGTVSMRGYTSNTGTSIVGQQNSGIKYTVSSNAVNMTFPNYNAQTTPFVSGPEYLYISPDGNFVFGGSPQGFDIFVGVRTSGSSGSGNLGGFYYQLGADLDLSQLSSNIASIDSYYGSLKAVNGVVVGHERTTSYNYGVYGLTYDDTYSNGNYSDPYMSWTVAANGTIRIGFGIAPYLGLNVALQLPPFPAPTNTVSVYLDPTGVVNSGSFSPFTAGIAPGEYITLFGSNLAASTQVASSAPFPTTLSNVQVLIDSIPAPIYYVSPTQISALVPYSASTFGVATIQVVNNGSSSNTVTEFVYKTVPGVFTQTSDGIGYGAVEHLNGSKVTPSNPAQVGETVSVYLTGLGAVFPPVNDGAAAPSNPLSYTTNTITADVNGTTATVLYAGLAPPFVGLYQINLTIPSGVTQGDNIIDISGPDSYASQAVISIGSSGATASVTTAEENRGPQAAKHRKPRVVQNMSNTSRIIPLRVQ